ncbi:hypothetical protein ES703_112804 [subsurface metagenome]
MFEERDLVAEHFTDVKFVVASLFDNVIKHCIVAGMFFYDTAHCGYFMGIENGFEITRWFKNSRQYRWHPHKFVRNDDCRAFSCADCF